MKQGQGIGLAFSGAAVEWWAFLKGETHLVIVAGLFALVSILATLAVSVRGSDEKA